MTETKPSPDPSRVIASLARDQVNLDLKTVDLCFLAGLYLRADQAALASFEEDVLVDLFEQVCDVVEPGAENPRKRATHAIQRLREQRMLARVDGAGIVRAGEYALTRLAAAVVQSLLADEALTRESLTLLTGTLGAQLAEILAAAKKAEGEDAWRTTVAGPLRITVADLVAGIERRQRGLDAESDGYFYLLPSGDRLGRRQLSAGEMLVGQTLALLYLDPSTLQRGGVVARATLLERLSGLLGTDLLVRTLNPRKRKYDERIAGETVRSQVGEALRRLADLGFVDLIDEGSLRLRPALMRFAEPVRGLADPTAALELLVAQGKVFLGETSGDEDEADDEAGTEEEPA